MFILEQRYSNGPHIWHLRNPLKNKKKIYNYNEIRKTQRYYDIQNPPPETQLLHFHTFPVISSLTNSPSFPVLKKLPSPLGVCAYFVCFTSQFDAKILQCPNCLVIYTTKQKQNRRGKEGVARHNQKEMQGMQQSDNFQNRRLGILYHPQFDWKSLLALSIAFYLGSWTATCS